MSTNVTTRPSSVPRRSFRLSANRPSVRVHVFMTVDEKELLQTYAARANQSVSAFVREVLFVDRDKVRQRLREASYAAVKGLTEAMAQED